jgi:hypothetical protein
MSLDWVENQFFTAEATRPVRRTGRSIARRPGSAWQGRRAASHPPHPLRIDGGTIYAECPASLPDD